MRTALRVRSTRVTFWTAALLLAGCGGSPCIDEENAMAETSDEKRTLRHDSSEERTIGAGQTHTWLWSVEGGDVGRLEVHELGADVMVRLFQGESEEPELEVDGLDEEWGVERLGVCPEEPTRYRVEIESLSRQPAGGRYRLEVAPAAEATDLDRASVRAEARFDSGERVRRLATDESRREALAIYREARGLFAEAEVTWGVLATLRRMGHLHAQLGERAEARSFYRELQELGEGVEEARGWNHLGELDLGVGDLASARECFQKALDLAEALDDGPLRAHARNNLAVIRLREEDLTGAVRDLQAVDRLWQDLGRSSERADVLTNLSTALRLQGKYPEALDVLDEALELGRRRHDRPGVARTWMQIGAVRQLMLEPEAAAEAFERALTEGGEELPGELRALLHNSLGVVHGELGEGEKAAHHYERARQQAHDVGLPRTEAMACLNFAALRQKEGDPAGCLELLARARELFTRLDDRRNLAACRLIEARALREQGEPQAALARLEAAVEEVEALRLKQAGWAQRMAFFATRQGYYDELVELLFELYRETGDLVWAERALHAGERRRARSLLDSVAEGGLAFRGDPSLLDLEHRQGEELAEVSRELDLGPDAAEADRLERRKRRLLVRLATTRAEIQRSSPQYAELTRPAPLDLEALRERVLDAETRLLVYALGERRSLLFLLEPEEPLRVFELPGRETIDHAVGLARTAFTSRSPQQEQESRRALQQLSNLVLGPLAETLDERRLAIVADGSLEQVPFAALPEPAPDGSVPRPGEPSRPWLLTAREVVHLPSASVLAALREEVAGRVPVDFEVAVFADPVFSAEDPRATAPEASEAPEAAEDGAGGLLRRVGVRRGQSLGEALDRLPASAAEAGAIRELVSAPESSLFALGFEASREVFENGRLEDFRILHFATHGFLDPVDPELSGLALSMVDESGREQDGFLRAHELYSRRLGADLVVLSACQTGLGRHFEGEGLVGLPRGFLYAGVPRVIVSLWNVADESTAELMGHLYRGLADGLAPAAALRRAQLAMLDSPNPLHALPFHWAPFVFLGDWRPAQGWGEPPGGGVGTDGGGTVVVTDPLKGPSYSLEGDSGPSEAKRGDGSKPEDGQRDGHEAGDPLIHPADFTNGVDGETGELLVPHPQIPPKTLYLRPRAYRRIRSWAEKYPKLRLPVRGVDPEELSEAGWAVLFGPDADHEVRQALKPLLDLRRQQAGPLYQAIDLPAAPNALAFLADLGVATGPAEPSKLPYYLLLVGDPELLPFDFQAALDVQYAVGRIHFDKLEGYARYARAVERAEEIHDLDRSAVFWGADIQEDPQSRWMIRGLVDPLVADLRRWQREQSQCLFDLERAADGGRETLAELLGPRAPAFLFTASHGMVFPGDPALRREYQGALLCEGWQPGRPPAREDFFAAEDLEDKADLAGLIAVHFACFSTGCSREDPFARAAVGGGRRQSERAFVSRLSQGLLASGAQAVAGHIDRTFRTSFTWEQEGDQIRVLSSMLRQLLEGHRLGHTTEWVNTRYAECAALLNPLLDQRPRPGTESAKLLQKLREATLNARRFLVVGDPAVRLVGSAARTAAG